MNILIIEAFYIDSHKQWLDGLIKYSSHKVTKLTLPGFHWKWRMHGAAITLANEFKKLDRDFDLILCSDMLDLSTFLAILRFDLSKTPVGLYFHENQLTYPWSPTDKDISNKRDRHYAFINYTSALAADFVLFNSQYHLQSFLGALPNYLEVLPDFKNLNSVDEIKAKSQVLKLGLDLLSIDKYKAIRNKQIPNIVWNHRWEYDKNPDLFFQSLFNLKQKGLKFTLTVLGKQYPNTPEVFTKAKEILSEEIIHWGYLNSFDEYAQMLCKADILPVTSTQDFFGISVVEAIYAGAIPILPRRLAYPEHLEDDTFFYLTDDEFAEKLENHITSFPLRPKINLEKIVSYDWARQIIHYDALFSKLSANFARK